MVVKWNFAELRGAALQRLYPMLCLRARDDVPSDYSPQCIYTAIDSGDVEGSAQERHSLVRMAARGVHLL